MSRLGFLGPQGTFTEIAAKTYARRIDEYIPYGDIKALINAVSRGEVDKVIVPIENSIQGGVTLTLDLLVEHDVKIISEVIIPVKHSLLTRKTVELDKIKHVMSISQALAQCRSFLEDNLVDYQVHFTNSTVEGAEKLHDLDDSWAVIGNSEAAKHYNLEILRKGIQDNEENWTRFVVLSQEEVSATANDKTSIICSLGQDHPGALYDILHEFAIRGINLTRIESRPAKKLLGDYIFFIDFEGHYQEKMLEDALDLVNYKASWYKLLGSYPKSMVIDDYSVS
ncbi:prephenate dehydratase [Orenia marismortui]|uniref:prephenate dehydratase n=1 Tax=Orenia marismortui TaxID=46469 RepID=UPI00036AC4A7|nr:prephenate dehydratase [Orenia marismortui]